MEYWNLPFPGPQKHAQLAPNSGTGHSGVQYFLSQLVRPDNCRNIPISLIDPAAQVSRNEITPPPLGLPDQSSGNGKITSF
jgi:hypothetical protein